jgi:hypothetical protein
MKRRQFIQVVCSLPLFAVIQQGVAQDVHYIPSTVKELAKWMDRQFDTSHGARSAYGYDALDRKYIYETYALKTYATPNAEERLVRSLYSTFLYKYPKGTKMYWRLPAEIHLIEMKKDEEIHVYEDMVQIRTRVAFI